MTHYKDARRLAITGFILGRFKIKTWVETGAYEGETCWFWSKWVQNSIGCEMSADVVARAKKRHEGTKVKVMLGVSPGWLNSIDVASPIFFYLDSNWRDQCVLLDELKTIRSKWIDYVVLANALPIKSNPNFKGDPCVPVPAEEFLKPIASQYTQVLIPNYSAPELGNPNGPWAGYAILNPSFDRIPHGNDWTDLCA